MSPDDILTFWFEELEQKQWFASDHEFDKLIKDRFIDVHGKAARAELWEWRKNIQGRLAEVIVLDQFSRNIYRGEGVAFATDPLALALSQEALGAPDLPELDSTRKAFLYMPFMHSESKAIHEKAVQLFSEPGLESNLNFELRHKAIIDRFGRYPHRNEVLGRRSTPEEVEFLKEKGSSF